MSTADRFLDLYCRLEELLEHKYGYESSSTNNVIIQFIQSRQGSRYRDQLNICREIRNVLSHHSNIGGEPVVEPAGGLVAVLEEVIAELETPPTVMDYATKAENIVMTTPSRPVLELMRVMDKEGFSHIPIWYYGEMIGVFSRSTVFSYSLAHPDESLDAETKVEHFAEYYPIKCHMERFLFTTPEMTLWEAREAFRQVYKHKRLAVIFVTDSGTEKGTLLGMLTPWDVMGVDEIGVG